ncbi:MAG: hypothetical protein AMXMBFR64_05730 [Myxococcales bacterium]
MRWVLVVMAAACGDGAADQPPELPAGATCAADLERPDGLLVAGSGAGLPVARAIARTWGSGPVRIPESIGTSGAIRALLDGSIDVGLASRPLTDEEHRQGLAGTPLARSIIAFVANKAAPVEGVDDAMLADIYGGRMTAWPDGTPLVPVLREPGDSGAEVLRAHAPRVFEAMEQARREGRGVVATTDQEARDALLQIQGAVGPLDLGIVRLEGLPLRPLHWRGIAPEPSEVLAGRYPLVRTLWLLTRQAPGPEARAFLALATSKEVEGVFGSGGYLRP